MTAYEFQLWQAVENAGTAGLQVVEAHRQNHLEVPLAQLAESGPYGTHLTREKVLWHPLQHQFEGFA